MKAMVIPRIVSLGEEEEPLELTTLPDPEPNKDEIVIKVLACGVCHTELDEIEGRTPPTNFPMVPGHQIVGEVVGKGHEVSRFDIGDVVGTGWIYSSCGHCEFCENGLENLCPDFKATGRDAHGGYAEYFLVSQEFAFEIPNEFTPTEAAPLLCAGAIGYRSLMLSGISDGDLLGLSGFGGSGHLVLKMVKHKHPSSQVFVFARDAKQREFAKSLGAAWVGDFGDAPPELVDAIIDTTPVWRPIVESLKCLKPGGRLVINAIRKEEIDKDFLLRLDYTSCMWMEKEIKSVANVTKKDIEEFLVLAGEMSIKPEVQIYSLEEANKALLELRRGKIKGSKVLQIC